MKNLTWQNPEQLFVAQELINKVKSKCCGIKVYQLPPKELASKYIAISAYNGSFSLEKLSELLGCDATTYYSSPLDFCVSRGYIEISNERVIVTPLGFKYYGALFSLFYASW